MPFTIEKQELGTRTGRGLPDRVPCYLLDRLALDDTADLRGMRLGSALLAEALSRASAAALDVGGRFVVVDAIDETVASFYAHHGFVPVPGVRDRLLIRVKDVATKLGWSGDSGRSSARLSAGGRKLLVGFLHQDRRRPPARRAGVLVTRDRYAEVLPRRAGHARPSTVIRRRPCR